MYDFWVPPFVLSPHYVAAKKTDREEEEEESWLST